MTQFTIPTNPNQAFFCSAGGFSFRLDFMLFNGITYCSISEGSANNQLIDGAKVCANCGILPLSLTRTYGQFVFLNTVGGAYPTYENFNGDNVLTYFSPDEVLEQSSYATKNANTDALADKAIPDNGDA